MEERLIDHIDNFIVWESLDFNNIDELDRLMKKYNLHNITSLRHTLFALDFRKPNDELFCKLILPYFNEEEDTFLHQYAQRGMERRFVDLYCKCKNFKIDYNLMGSKFIPKILEDYSTRIELLKEH